MMLICLKITRIKPRSVITRSHTNHTCNFLVNCETDFHSNYTPTMYLKKTETLFKFIDNLCNQGNTYILRK